MAILGICENYLCGSEKVLVAMWVYCKELRSRNAFVVGVLGGD